MNYGIWETVHHYPPILVRLLARKPYRGPLTAQEIATTSGLSLIQVEAVSQSTDWRNIDLPTAEAFVKACRVDFGDWKQMDRVRAYLIRGTHRPTWQYLRVSGLWASYYKPLIERYLASVTQQQKGVVPK